MSPKETIVINVEFQKCVINMVFFSNPLVALSKIMSSSQLSELKLSTLQQRNTTFRFVVRWQKFVSNWNIPCYALPKNRISHCHTCLWFGKLWSSDRTANKSKHQNEVWTLSGKFFFVLTLQQKFVFRKS